MTKNFCEATRAVSCPSVLDTDQPHEAISETPSECVIAIATQCTWPLGSTKRLSAVCLMSFSCILQTWRWCLALAGRLVQQIEWNWYIRHWSVIWRFDHLHHVSLSDTVVPPSSSNNNFKFTLQKLCSFCVYYEHSLFELHPCYLIVYK